MVKNNKSIAAGSEGVWSSLKKPTNLQSKEKPQTEQKIDNSRNLDFDENSKDCRKPKRFSSKNGEEFTVSKGIVLTKEVNRKLNMVKALSDNMTYNEIVDEALHEYCNKHLNQ